MTDLPEISQPPKNLPVGAYNFQMTYGMLMEMSRMLPDPSAALQLAMNDNFTQDYIIRRLATPINTPVKSIDDLVEAHTIDLDTDAFAAVLTWVVQHVLYFFIKRTRSLQEAGQAFQRAFPALANPSSSGSENSASETPSPGPLTA